MPGHAMQAHAGAARRREVLRRRRGAPLRQPRGRRRVDPRPGRRERRRQVDAGQDPRRGPPPRRRRPSASSGATSTSARPAESQGRRHRGDLPGAHALPRPLGHREHLHGPAAPRQPAAASTARRCTPRPQRCSPASASRSTPPDGPRPVHRRPADHRDRQGLSLDARAARDGRADRRTAAAWRSSGCSTVARAPARRGPGAVFISHRFDEVFDLCDAVTVMRDGAPRRHAPTSPRLTVDEVVR